jgi:hypothetical protein
MWDEMSEEEREMIWISDLTDDERRDLGAGVFGQALEIGLTTECHSSSRLEAAPHPRIPWRHATAGERYRA